MRASFITSEVTSGLRRNVTMTVAMILTTAISLAMFGGGLLVVQMANKSQDIFLERVELQIFLDPAMTAKDPNCSQAECQALVTGLKNADGTESVTFISQDAAYRDAITKTFANQPELANLVRPGVLPASIKVKMGDPSKFSAVTDEFAHKPGVASVLDQRDLVNRIFSVLNGARNAAFAIALIQAVAAILLIANTVQVAAFTRQREVSIMRMVGASRWYTQLPFLLEAMVSALVGALIAIGALAGAKGLFFDKALKDLYGVNILAKITMSDVLFISPWLILTAVVMSGATAYLTLRFYVRDR